MVSNDKIMRHVRVQLQNLGPSGEGPDKAVTAENKSAVEFG